MRGRGARGSRGRRGRRGSLGGPWPYIMEEPDEPPHPGRNLAAVFGSGEKRRCNSRVGLVGSLHLSRTKTPGAHVDALRSAVYEGSHTTYVGQPPAGGLDIRVAHLSPYMRAFSTDLAAVRHDQHLLVLQRPGMYCIIATRAAQAARPGLRGLRGPVGPARIRWTCEHRAWACQAKVAARGCTVRARGITRKAQAF